MTRRLSCLSLVILFAMTANTQAQQTRPPSLSGRSTVYAPRGAIATSQPLATAAGLAVLGAGGNAIDAAVAAAAVLNVVEPHMTGIGGDLFALFWSARENKLIGLDASGRAGALMTREELIRRGRDGMPGRGAEAITVPGALSGWSALLAEYGSVTLAEALGPAIRIAEEGFPVTPIIAGQWAAEVDKLSANEGASQTYLVGGVRAPQAGEWFSNPDLAATFRLIADQGPAVFYGGALGQRVVDGVQLLGGFLTLEDLATHRPEWVEPISADYRGYRVWELPPSGQGVAALEMLRILQPFALKSMGHNSPEYLHHLIEAKKLAYADLARYVADRDHMTISTDELLSDEFIDARRSLLDPSRAADRPSPGPAVTSSETIYLSVADRDGNMVSFINSVYSAFGSGVVVPGTGFALQNRGGGFTLEADHPNMVAPGKRPFHTIIPAFVTKDNGNGHEPWLSYGVMGGSMQPQGHVQVLLNLVLFDMDLQDAVDAGRFRHMGGRRIALETPITDEVRQALEAMGHEIVDETSVSFGGSQAVMRLPRGWAAASDPRKDGMAAGH
ncbi:MAG: gamma-glutamyltransferase [Gemmatimonadetes bacterium]|nr:gamma-glutamyltransferase [Gemmatimonadota bacterium]